MKREFEEKIFKDFFCENTDKCLKHCILINKEEPLYGYAEYIKDRLNQTTRFQENKSIVNYKNIGRIDLIIRYYATNYCVEIKYHPYNNSEFWDALKIVGYTEYYNFCEEPSKPFKPAIFLPKNKIKLETLIIATKLKITLFGITKEIGYYKVEKIDDDFKIHFN
jgi:hypothetical protein